MNQQELIRASIDALHANIAVLDRKGSIVEVNRRWRSFGRQRAAPSDYVGLNYLEVCARAADNGEASATRVERGLRRILVGDAGTFGLVYDCADRAFRMSVRPLSNSLGGVIVAHEDVTALLRAKREQQQTHQSLSEAREHAGRLARIHEELGQRLAAISMAAAALDQGADVADAVMLIKMAVDEARHELRFLRRQSYN